MSSDLIITRMKIEEAEADDGQISLETWKDLVANDPELSLEETVETKLGTGFSFKVSSPGMAVWTTYPLAKMQGIASLFVFRKGTIVAKNADGFIRDKAFEVAGKLQAGILADAVWLLPLQKNGSGYSAAQQDIQKETSERKPWWRFW